MSIRQPPIDCVGMLISCTEFVDSHRDTEPWPKHLRAISLIEFEYYDFIDAMDPRYDRVYSNGERLVITMPGDLIEKSHFVKRFLASRLFGKEWTRVLTSDNIKGNCIRMMKYAAMMQHMNPNRRVVGDLIHRIGHAIATVYSCYVCDRRRFPFGLEARHIGQLLAHYATRCSETIRLEIQSVKLRRQVESVWEKLQVVLGDIPQYYLGRAWNFILNSNDEVDTIFPYPLLYQIDSPPPSESSDASSTTSSTTSSSSSDDWSVDDVMSGEDA